jgi:hypothetical protein
LTTAERRGLGTSGSPAFVVYLLALAVLPFRWLSPISSLYEHADWSDLLIGVSALLWLFERLHKRDLRHSYRAWFLPLGLYLLLSIFAAATAVSSGGGSFKTVLLMAELAILAVITADFAGQRGHRRAIARVVVASSLISVLLGAVGLILFYAGHHSGLLGAYGDLQTSNVFARVQAGFESPNLLASFCIFASGLVASEDAQLGRSARVACQTALFLLVLSTFSRGVIGFLLAATLRRSLKLRGRRRWLIPAGALLLSVTILAVLTAGSVRVNLGDLSHARYVFPDRSLRGESFVASLRTLVDHPMLGIGPGGLPGRLQGAPARAHFTALNVAATIGIPALLALLAMLWMVWRGRRRPTDIGVWSAAAGVALDGLAQDIDHFRHVWVLLGLLGSPRDRRGISRP